MCQALYHGSYFLGKLVAIFQVKWGVKSVKLYNMLNGNYSNFLHEAANALITLGVVIPYMNALKHQSDGLMAVCRQYQHPHYLP